MSAPSAAPKNRLTLFSVPKLGYAKDTSLPEFDTVVFNNFTAG